MKANLASLAHKLVSHASFASIQVGRTLAINGAICDTHPRVAEAGLTAGWKFIGNGWVQGPMPKVDNQAEAIALAMTKIISSTGARPQG
ncbi:MAG: hypothetical protein QNK94_03175 [Comamonadaceae bacterium]